MSPTRLTLAAPVDQAELSRAVLLATPAGPNGGDDRCRPDLDNDAALENAYRLVGIPYGRAWEQVKARDGLTDALQSAQGQAATTTIGERSGPAGAVVVASCAAAIAAAELSGSAFGAIPGAAFDAALALLLVILFAWRPGARSAPLLPVLALVALVRPISLAAVAPSLPPLAWYALAGLPLLVGAMLATRLLEEPVRELHLRIQQPWVDAAVAAAGPSAGLVGYLLLTPAAFLGQPNPISYAVMVAVLIVFGGLVEELIFRGLVLNAAVQALGDEVMGVAVTAALSMALYWGSGSIPYMLFMGLVGGALGLALLRGASLWGVALSHGLMLVTMALLAQELGR
jgi:membrane protease YdiL (CAAX protease family)